VLSKKDRLKLFFQRVGKAPPANSADDALHLISATLNAVEDEHSGVEFNPDAWVDDGRMYPPTEMNRRNSGNARLRRYRSAKHNTFLGENGSITIEDLEGGILLNKSGFDGRTVPTFAKVDSIPSMEYALHVIWTQCFRSSKD
jgi:hypothetical protein